MLSVFTVKIPPQGSVPASQTSQKKFYWRPVTPTGSQHQIPSAVAKVTVDGI
jgi:hypothetical protein